MSKRQVDTVLAGAQVEEILLGPNQPLPAEEYEQIQADLEESRQRDRLQREERRRYWPPFPLAAGVDVVQAAIKATRLLCRSYIPEHPFFGKQLCAAMDVARDMKLAWMDEGIELAAIPLAQDMHFPELHDVYAMESWFVDCRAAIVKHVAEQTASTSAKAQAATADNARCVPMKLSELCRRYMDDQDARSDKVKPALERHGLRQESERGNRWTVCVDNLDHGTRDRMMQPTYP